MPYLVGVVAHVQASDLDPPFDQWDWTARLTGLVPGFVAHTVYDQIGFAGGFLLGFLALSALTIVTLAWHPLRRLRAADRSGKADKPDGADKADRSSGRRRCGRSMRRRRTLPAAAAAQSARKVAEDGKTPARRAGSSRIEDELPPIELLAPPSRAGHRRR